MPASITLLSLSFALPGGRILFSDLTLGFNQERTGPVGRNGIGKSTRLDLVRGEGPRPPPVKSPGMPNPASCARILQTAAPKRSQTCLQ